MSDSDKLKHYKKMYKWHVKSAEWYKKAIAKLEGTIIRNTRYSNSLSLRTV